MSVRINMGITNFQFFTKLFHYGKFEQKKLLTKWTQDSLKYKLQNLPIVLCIDSIALLYKYMRYFSDNIQFTEEDLQFYSNGEYEHLENKYFTQCKISELANLGIQYLFALIPSWLIHCLREIIIFIDGIAPASKSITTLQRNNKLISSKHLILSRRIRALVAQEFYNQLSNFIIDYSNCCNVQFVESKFGEGERLCLLEAKKKAQLFNVLILANDYDIMSGMLLINSNLPIYTIKMTLTGDNKFIPSSNQNINIFNEDVIVNWSSVFKWPKTEMKNRMLLFFLLHYVNNDYIVGVKSGTEQQYAYLISCYVYICFHQDWKKEIEFNKLVQNIIDNCCPLEDNTKYVQMYHFNLQLMYGFIFFNPNSTICQNEIDNFFTLWTTYIKSNKKIDIDLQIENFHKDFQIVQDVLIVNLWYLGYTTSNQNPTSDNITTFQFDHVYNFNKQPQFKTLFKQIDFTLKWNQKNYQHQHLIPNKEKYSLVLNKLYNSKPLSSCIDGVMYEGKNNPFPHLLSQMIYYFFNLL